MLDVHQTGNGPLPELERRLDAARPLRRRVGDRAKLVVIKGITVASQEHRPCRRALALSCHVVDLPVGRAQVDPPAAAHEVRPAQLAHRVLLAGDRVRRVHRALWIGEAGDGNRDERRSDELLDRVLVLCPLEADAPAHLRRLERAQVDRHLMADVADRRGVLGLELVAA